MNRFCETIFFSLFTITLFAQNNSNPKINRKIVVERHRIITTSYNPRSPAQVGNGEFAFSADITGLQTFVPFNTMSHWSWHSFPLPSGHQVEDFRGGNWNTHDRMIRYDIPNRSQPELVVWLAGNPHRFNLGRIGFLLIKADGSAATITDLKNIRQEVDLWNGIIYSQFTLEGEHVGVKTACHPSADAIGVTAKSDLIKAGRIKVFFDFPYPDTKRTAAYVGDYNQPDAHSSVLAAVNEKSALITRKADDTKYLVSLNWSDKAHLLNNSPGSKHRFILEPLQTDQISFTCNFSKEKTKQPILTASDIISANSKVWPEYWLSGAAIDLSQSKDHRWKELERRIILSQYLMKVNESGSYPSQEAGLVSNGWYGRFHFEMIWWHSVHFMLWNRSSLLDKSLKIYNDFLPTSQKRAAQQGYRGARWPKCTADIDRDWPHLVHAMLIWQQPHPIYFAELDYREHPNKKTLEKWRDVVLESAAFMADYTYYESSNDRYILGPPLHIVSENTKPAITINPSFELGYWCFGLITAQKWRERLGLARDLKWDEVINKLSPLPQNNGLYVTHEKIDSMWTKFSFEHPALIGTFGMLPGNGVDTVVFKNTLSKVISTWDFNRTWGWDFPMLAMAAARTGNPELALNMLLHSSKNFQFDEHGYASGGPFPYFPSNGGLLTAVAMMSAGWDGSSGSAPGFPKTGNWIVRYENFNKMP